MHKFLKACRSACIELRPSQLGFESIEVWPSYSKCWGEATQGGFKAEESACCFAWSLGSLAKTTWQQWFIAVIAHGLRGSSWIKWEDMSEKTLKQMWKAQKRLQLPSIPHSRQNIPKCREQCTTIWPKSPQRLAGLGAKMCLYFIVFPFLNKGNVFNLDMFFFCNYRYR